MQINLNLSTEIANRIAIALERIADALDRFLPPVPIQPLTTGPTQPEDMVVFSPEREWEREREEERKARQGLPPKQR